jgi:xanthine dehydrogenase accessory factor
VLVNPLDDPSVAGKATHLFESRQPFVLGLPLGAGHVTIEPGEPTWRTSREAGAFLVSHLPRLNVVIIGHGASVEALNAQARTIGAMTRVFTPDAAIADRLAGTTPVTLLRMPSDKVGLSADPWTAIAFVFHDHDWESQLLVEALASPAFYVGAMGGRIAHARRTAMLERAGVSAASISRMRAPIGLIASSREPQVLALSALSEIVRDFGDVTDRADVEDEIAAERASINRQS